MHILVTEGGVNNGALTPAYTYTYYDNGLQHTKKDSYGTTAYTYDAAGRVTEVEMPGKTTLYTYDDAGNRESQTETYTSAQTVDDGTGKIVQYTIKTSQYFYSDADKLVKLVEVMDGSVEPNSVDLLQKETNYAYDDNGNQLSQWSVYIKNNKGTSGTVSVGVYAETDTEFDNKIETVTNEYDGFNRLIKAQSISKGKYTNTQYAYNGDNLRIKRTARRSDRSYDSEVTNYLYSGQNVILETDASDNVNARYVLGTSYIARIGKTSVPDDSDHLSYFMYNGHGDVVQTVDGNGNVENQYDYDIFGNSILTIEEGSKYTYDAFGNPVKDNSDAPSGAYSNPIRYAGEFYDSETGNYYLRSRYYNPYQGRFITEDTFGGFEDEPLSLNRYTYAHNDPIQYKDPTGHWAESDFEDINDYGLDLIAGYTQDYYNATTDAGRQAAHNAAEAVRNSGDYNRTGEYESDIYMEYQGRFNDAIADSEYGWISSDVWNGGLNKADVYWTGSQEFGERHQTEIGNLYEYVYNDSPGNWRSGDWSSEPIGDVDAFLRQPLNTQKNILTSAMYLIPNMTPDVGARKINGQWWNEVTLLTNNGDGIIMGESDIVQQHASLVQGLLSQLLNDSGLFDMSVDGIYKSKTSSGVMAINNLINRDNTGYGVYNETTRQNIITLILQMATGDKDLGETPQQSQSRIRGALTSRYEESYGKTDQYKAARQNQIDQQNAKKTKTTNTGIINTKSSWDSSGWDKRHGSSKGGGITYDYNEMTARRRSKYNNNPYSPYYDHSKDGVTSCIISDEQAKKVLTVAINILVTLKTGSKSGAVSTETAAIKGVSNARNVINTTRVQNVLDTMPELTGTNREKLLSAIQNENLSKIANELYRPGATIGDGGTAAGLVDDFIKGNSKHLQKANERVIGLKNALNSNELGLNDLDIAEALLDDLQDAINLFK